MININDLFTSTPKPKPTTPKPTPVITSGNSNSNSNSSSMIDELFKTTPTPTKIPTKIPSWIENIEKLSEYKEMLDDSKFISIIDEYQKEYNTLFDCKQTEALWLTYTGESFCLLGAAGTGKTFISALIMRIMMAKSHRQVSYRIQGSGGERAYGDSVACVAYTRQAVSNLLENHSKDPILADAARWNRTTVHNLLEYQPVYIVEDDGTVKRLFEPSRNEDWPLDISGIVIDEAGTLSTDPLWRNVTNAMPSRIQTIAIGDPYQLPPAFGSSLLIYGITHGTHEGVKVIELTKIYRQAADNPIIRQSQRVKVGLTPKEDIVGDKGLYVPKIELRYVNPKNEDQTRRQHQDWQSIIDSFLEERKGIDPDNYFFLCPYGKDYTDKDSLNNNHRGLLSASEINKMVANTLGKQREATVYHIVGRREGYFAIGDRVKFGYFTGEITRIKKNPAWRPMGKICQKESTRLDRWGMLKSNGKLKKLSKEERDFTHTQDIISKIKEMSEMLNEETTDKGKDKNKDKGKNGRSEEDLSFLNGPLSHCITIWVSETESEIIMTTMEEFAELELNYASTVHKAIGRQWREIVLLAVGVHAHALNREMLYTAMTRAQVRAYLYVPDKTLTGAARRSVFPGNTLRDKVSYYLENYERPENMSMFGG